MKEPKFKIGQEVFCNVDLCRMTPKTIGFHKVRIAAITTEKIETENTGQINIIYRCEIEDKFRTEFDPLIERNWYGKAKEPYRHIFDINESNLFLEADALEIFKNWINQ